MSTLSRRNLCSAIVLLLSAGACRDATEPQPAAPVTSVEIGLVGDTLFLGDTVRFTAVAHDADGNVVEDRRVQWTVPTGGAYVSIDSLGRAVVLQAPTSFVERPYTVIVQATLDSVSDVDTLFVERTPTYLKVSGSALIRVGRTREMIASFYDHFYFDLPRRPVRWSSSDSTVASVTQAGVVTALREGTATITARVAGVFTSQELRVVAGGYSLAALGTLGGSSARAHDVNDHGEVVGEAQDAAGAPHAVSWRNGAPRDLGPGSAKAINNQGMIVGFHNGSARWINGVPERLTTPEGLLGGEAIDVDEQGRVLFAGGGQAGLWANGDTTHLTTTRQWQRINGMNGLAWVVGSMYGADPVDAVLLRDRVVVPVAGSRIEAQAMAVNDRGDLVGYSVGFRPRWTTAFLRMSDGAFRGLGQLGGDYMEAWDLNERAEVVGWGRNARQEERGFVWSNGVMAELTDLLAAPGWVVLRADAINESGQIAAAALNTATGQRVPVLLTPLP